MKSSSSAGGSSFGSHITTSISVGLCGLAGRPKISLCESEAWIMDPRTPVKKFAALLFKLANVRQQIHRQLNKEFLSVTTLGQSDTALPSQNSSFLSTTEEGHKDGDQWYYDFVLPLLSRLLNENNLALVKLGPVKIQKKVIGGYKYFFLGEQETNQSQLMLLPDFVTKYLVSETSSVKEMLRALRRESLLIIINYQFGFKRLDKLY